jgi:hypothetical protein
MITVSPRKGIAGAVAPVDLGGLQALRAFLLLGAACAGSSRLFAQRRFDLADADPLRRVHAQPFGPDDEADAACAARAQARSRPMLLERISRWACGWRKTAGASTEAIGTAGGLGA